MYLDLGTTSLRNLEEFHYFREGLGFLYFCPRCIRNFETPAPAKRCRCGSAVRLLRQKEKHGKDAQSASFGLRKYNYFCEKCGRVESGKRAAECPSCKGMIVTVYKWDELNIGDRILIWISKISSKARTLNDTSANKTPEHEKTIHLKMPKLSFRIPRLSFMPKDFSFTKRSREELPTY